VLNNGQIEILEMWITELVLDRNFERYNEIAGSRRLFPAYSGAKRRFLEIGLKTTLQAQNAGFRIQAVWDLPEQTSSSALLAR
jgi:hypothetical protein